MKRTVFLLVAGLILLNACSSNKQESKEAKPLVQVQSLSASDSAKYLELGDDLVSTTKQKISTTLVEAMEKGGVKYAAQFCNLAAYPIVDSLSTVHNARIRRVSDKPRNPKDAMDDEEQKVFAMFAAQLQQPDAEIKPILMQHRDGSVGYYTPIKISMPTCLKCHGEVGKDVKPEDYAEIKKLYPNDNAVGYKQGDLRGMFSIRFAKAH
ncbi:MAG: DUF3365 domain-containing protein [Candidatus Thermochlorobacter sp.]